MNKLFFILLIPVLFFNLVLSAGKPADVKDKMTTMDTSLKTPYYNFLLNTQEISLQVRLKAGPFYLEPKIICYPESLSNSSLLRPGVMDNPIPYGGGAEFGLLLKEAPDIIEFFNTGSSNKNLLDSMIESAGHAVEHKASKDWYSDLYIYFGGYQSPITLETMTNKQIETPCVMLVLGTKRLNLQKIREVPFDNEKYYVTPGKTNAYDGSGVEIRALPSSDFGRLIIWGESKIYREFSTNLRIFRKLDISADERNKIEKRTKINAEIALSFVSESFANRSSLRLGFGLYTESVEPKNANVQIEVNQAGIKLYPLLDYVYMF